VFIAASSACFPHLSLEQALEKMLDLEFSYAELVVGPGAHLDPDQVVREPQRVAYRCQHTYRVTPVAYYLDFEGFDRQFYERFHACCMLAKATKVVSLTVRSAELGTPFNQEVERLKALVKLATLEGVVVSITTETGRMSEDPDTAAVLCQHVKGLAVTLDPSHYICGPSGRDYKKLLPFVAHVRLRDTSKEKLQVQVGQGEVDYSRLIGQLESTGYRRALCIDIKPEPDGSIDHDAEVRKLRLLLETLLI